MQEPGLTVEEQNRVEREKALANARLVREAFTQTLGPIGKPTRYGAIILEYLRKHAGNGRRLPPLEVGDDGHTDLPRTFRSLGHYDVLQWIEDAITWKESTDDDSSRGST